ncbi:hypothetical protein PQU92_01615 [Asticcacaulis sp. BYS171W]|uniref:Uncharacterized protein n=1 Tax=Asticcacaulis aquaticus TaxID=2984212 RepID=A0ABT5HPG4_9CAUL|nr:hypothetical protein [Asticcacaulis aquaticus]MDC7681955.1 hypothetical protein [Asticcacaulis aquaticus]
MSYKHFLIVSLIFFAAFYGLESLPAGGNINLWRNVWLANPTFSFQAALLFTVAFLSFRPTGRHRVISAALFCAVSAILVLVAVAFLDPEPVHLVNTVAYTGAGAWIAYCVSTYVLPLVAKDNRSITSLGLFGLNAVGFVVLIAVMAGYLIETSGLKAGVLYSLGALAGGGLQYVRRKATKRAEID